MHVKTHLRLQVMTRETYIASTFRSSGITSYYIGFKDDSWFRCLWWEFHTNLSLLVIKRILGEMLSVWSFDDSILVWNQLQLWTSVRMEPRRSWWMGWEKSISGELKPEAVASEVSTTLSCTFPPNWMNFQRFSERPISVSSYNTKTVVLRILIIITMLNNPS